MKPDENTEEEWRAVPGNEGYEVSNLGRVRSIDRFVAYKDGRIRFCKGLVLTPIIDHLGYCRVKLKGGESQLIQRLVGISFLGVNRGFSVDHADGNPGNNLISNLRVCTKSQNAANSKKRSTNTSGFRGVCWHVRHMKWHAKIGVNGKRIHLGYFESKQAASRAYDEAVVRYFKEFARTNVVRAQAKAIEAEVIVEPEQTND